jgi:hypothetical protein
MCLGKQDNNLRVDVVRKANNDTLKNIHMPENFYRAFKLFRNSQRILLIG